MQSREPAFIRFFIRCPYRALSSVSLHPFSHPPSQQLSSLYLIQLADSTDHDESFLFDFPSSYSSLFLCLPLRFSPLVSALLIFILTRYTFCSFLYHFLVFQLPSDFHTRFIRNILKPYLFNRRY